MSSKKIISLFIIFVIILFSFGLFLLNQDTNNSFSKKIKDNTLIQNKKY